jgi:hypothetical protein
MLIHLTNRIENIELCKSLNTIRVKDADKCGFLACLKWVFE